MSTEESVTRLTVEVVDKFSKNLKSLIDQLAKVEAGQALKQSNDNLDRFSNTVKSTAAHVRGTLTPSLAALGVTTLSLAGALAAVVTSLRNFSRSTVELSFLSKETKIAVNDLRALQHMAKTVNIDEGSFQSSIRNWSVLREQMAHGMGTMNSWFSRQYKDPSLIEFGERLKNTKDEGKALMMTLDLLSKYEPKDARKIVEAMGFDERFIRLVLDQVNVYKKLEDAKKTLGPLDDKAITAAENYEKSMRDLSASFDKFVISLTPALEGLSKLIDKLTEWNKSEAAGWAKSLIETAKEINAAVESIGGWKVVAAVAVVWKVTSSIIRLTSWLGRFSRILGGIIPPSWLTFLITNPATLAFVMGLATYKGVSAAKAAIPGAAMATVKGIRGLDKDAIVDPIKRAFVAALETFFPNNIAVQSLRGGGGPFGSPDTGSGGGSRGGRGGSIFGGPTTLQEPQGNRAQTAMGITDEMKDAYRRGLARIESSGGNYGIMGGSSGRFAGAYQMGGAEIAESARSLGEPIPSREQFLRDPKMQERYLDDRMARHHQQLMANPAYAKLPLNKKLEILAYSHARGVGGANAYLRTGRSTLDAFGTPGTTYEESIRRELEKIQKKPLPLPSSPSMDELKKQIQPDNKPSSMLNNGVNSGVITGRATKMTGEAEIKIDFAGQSRPSGPESRWAFIDPGRNRGRPATVADDAA